MQRSKYFLAALFVLFNNYALSQAELKHPMLSSPGSSIAFGGKNSEFLVDGISNRSIFDLRTKWETSADKITRIPVCWESPDPKHEKLRDIVRNAIIVSWQSYSGIEFQNWGTCTAADSHAIRIAVGEYWPQTRGIGNQLSGESSGMKLNFDFNGPQEWKFCSRTPESCITKVSVHEFGHAIGFMHEQTRLDTPDTCLSTQEGEGTVTLTSGGYTTGGTPWDIDSVMNYCNPVWNNNGHLSSKDILMLQKVYGLPQK